MGRLGVALAALTVGLSVGVAAHAHQSLDELERALGEEATKRPDDPAVYVDRGKLMLQAKRFDEALVAFEHAAEHGADPDVVAGARGRVFLEAGWPRMATVEFDRVLARRPDAYGVLYDRGEAWLALGDPDRAARDFGAAIAGMRSPRPEQVFAYRDALLAAGRRADAVGALDAGIARLGPVAALELAAVDLEVELERWDAALRRLDRLLAKTPAQPAWAARRGEILQKAGREADAQRAYVSALAMIDARPADRRAGPLDELAGELRRKLAASSGATEGGR